MQFVECRLFEKACLNILRGNAAAVLGGVAVGAGASRARDVARGEESARGVLPARELLPLPPRLPPLLLLFLVEKYNIFILNYNYFMKPRKDQN